MYIISFFFSPQVYAIIVELLIIYVNYYIFIKIGAWNMKLSQIKTKEVRDSVRKSRYKKFVPAFIVLFLIIVVSVCFYSYYAYQKAKKNSA